MGGGRSMCDMLKPVSSEILIPIFCPVGGRKRVYLIRIEYPKGLSANIKSHEDVLDFK